MNYQEMIEKILIENSGIITSSWVRENNIPTTYLTRLTRQGKLKRVERGIYMAEDGIYDELFILQSRYPKIIFSYETALSLLNLTDRISQEISVTVNFNYKFNHKPKGVSIHYVKKDLLNLGVICKKTNVGNEVRLYSAERTVCDFIMNKKNIDTESYINFIKAYPKYQDRNIHDLYHIAEKNGCSFRSSKCNGASV